ncbi:hypothetical protein BDW22DRAFT_1329450 [Trametopsis cervina]|nr:hypothetical protein BDW22DRAFT_1329450 [Trametopsis cervina]
MPAYDQATSAQQTLDSTYRLQIIRGLVFTGGEVLYDISQLLNTQLNKDTLAVCVNMIESGVNPEALAAVVQELRRESAALNAQAQPNANGRN